MAADGQRAAHDNRVFLARAVRSVAVMLQGQRPLRGLAPDGQVKAWTAHAVTAGALHQVFGRPEARRPDPGFPSGPPCTWRSLPSRK